jgi:polyphosphate kinase 2 (PPK2 family)
MNLPGLEDVSLITDAFGKEDGANQNFEKHITENGTIVLKFFLHISRRSRERLLRRLEEKTQLEVLSGGLKERERWDDYMQYEEAINTSTDYALGM